MPSERKGTVHIGRQLWIENRLGAYVSYLDSVKYFQLWDLRLCLNLIGLLVSRIHWWIAWLLNYGCSNDFWS